MHSLQCIRVEIAISEFVLANLLNWEINLINAKKFKLYNWEDSMLFSNFPHGELNKKNSYYRLWKNR